jgi:murein DD-endopeptidase MepM/ murein hydrolase activator NlpD
MASENVRERKEKRRYTFVIVPDVKSEKTRNFSITRSGLVVVVISTIIIFLAGILAIIIYTPIGAQLPISQSAVAKKYNRQMSDVQKQLQSLLREMSVLRGYNIRLRNVLGEKIGAEDSVRLLNLPSDSVSLAERFRLDPEDTSYVAPMEQENAVPINQQTLGIEMMPMRSGVNIDVTSQLPLMMPMNGYIAREFDPLQLHYGIDFAGRAKMPVVAAASGTVVFSNWTNEDGFVMIIAHEGGYLSVYKHNYSLIKTIGDRVRRGETVALLGNTGERSSGPHLHFELWINGVVQNPAKYLLSIK